MPHEKVRDCTNHTIEADGSPASGDQRLGIISWSHGPTPSDEYSEPDGWVQLMTKDTSLPARFEADLNEAEAQIAALLKDFRFVTNDSKDALSHSLIEALTVYLAPYVRHAFGESVGGFAITLDRAGINRTIRLLQRARDIAYGRDA